MVEKRGLPPEFVEFVKSVVGKRPRAVIDHILEHGYVTTEDLQAMGYNHPPRAARDVREAGVPLETYRVRSSDGRSIGAYRFGNPSEVRKGRIKGRVAFPKGFKALLVEESDSHCAGCGIGLPSRYLQVDHRVPYEVAGDISFDPSKLDPAEYMLLCGSCNRSKSWSCEACENFQTIGDPEICSRCYWGSPEDYTHIAMSETRRVVLIWNEDEIANYERAQQQADAAGFDLDTYLKTKGAE